MRRCKAITTRGRRCRMRVPEGREFCHFHQEKRVASVEDLEEEKGKAADNQELQLAKAKEEKNSQQKETEEMTSSLKETLVATAPSSSPWEYWLSQVFLGVLILLLVLLSWWMVS